MDKENMYKVMKNGKSSERKNYGGKKKGLSLNAENCVDRMTSMHGSSIDKTKFQIYSDSNQSCSCVRKYVYKKEIRETR